MKSKCSTKCKPDSVISMFTLQTIHSFSCVQTHSVTSSEVRSKCKPNSVISCVVESVSQIQLSAVKWDQTTIFSIPPWPCCINWTWHRTRNTSLLVTAITKLVSITSSVRIPLHFLRIQANSIKCSWASQTRLPALLQEQTGTVGTTWMKKQGTPYSGVI